MPMGSLAAPVGTGLQTVAAHAITWTAVPSVVSGAPFLPRIQRISVAGVVAEEEEDVVATAAPSTFTTHTV
jgi:hypothetical protein